MAIARLTKNTSKDFPCTMCGGDGNIIREDATNPRLKCNNCNFTYDAQDSLAAKEAGSIPDGPPNVPEVEPEPSPIAKAAPLSTVSLSETKPRFEPLPLIESLPRNPSHVLVSKNRKFFDFVTEKTFKKKILEWEAMGRNYDVYQLQKSEYAVKVDLKD